jgi:metal-sulfur cluster biosynthetic enzyme
MGLIDATKVIESIDEIVCSMSVCINSDYCHGMTAMKDAAIHAIEEQPTVDAVPIGAVEQIRWERDMAMQQLSEHGIPFGGNADDVIKVCRCKECQWFDANGDYYDSYCDKNGISVEEDFYCADGERRTDGETDILRE